MLTPEEIEGSDLPRTVVGGYKADKVTEHLRRIAWDVRRLLHERGETGSELDRLRRELARSERRDELEAAVLDSAQRAAMDIRQAGRQEAELIVKKANEHADRLRRDVEREQAVRTREMEALKAASGKLRTELRTFIKSLLDVIEPGDQAAASGERSLVMADLERVVQATRAAKPHWAKIEGSVPSPVAAPATRPRDEAPPEWEFAADPRTPHGGADTHVIPLAGETAADGAERVA